MAACKTRKAQIQAGLACLALLADITSAQAAQPLAKVLPASRFSYPMKMGYAAAQQYPDVMAKLFCYCGCDKQDNHSSLLDCFLSTHGAYCTICLEEAVEAKRFKEEGVGLSAIQKQVDDRFAKYYPHGASPSAQILKYRSSLKTAGVRVTELPKTAAEAAKPRSQGSCCGNHNHR